MFDDDNMSGEPIINVEERIRLMNAVPYEQKARWSIVKHVAIDAYGKIIGGDNDHAELEKRCEKMSKKIGGSFFIMPTKAWGMGLSIRDRSGFSDADLGR